MPDGIADDNGYVIVSDIGENVGVVGFVEKPKLDEKIESMVNKALDDFADSLLKVLAEWKA